jgi:predicted small metal-binding protein
MTESPMKVTGQELGVVDCDVVFEGKTAGDVVEQAVEHLRSEHGIDMPDPDEILKGTIGTMPGDETSDEAMLVVQRLREYLDIDTDTGQPGLGDPGIGVPTTKIPPSGPTN